MKLRITKEERTALKAYLEASEDCEKLTEKEWVMDIYDCDTPASFDLVFAKDSLFADGAEYLKYDEEQDGWYIAGPIESAEKAVEILRAAGALG